MNLYRVISETLWAVEPCVEYLPGCTDGPLESYAIAELVAAESRGKAKYAAWKSDRSSFTGDFIDMPKMSCVRVAKDVEVPSGFYSQDDRFYHLWIYGYEPEELAAVIDESGDEIELALAQAEERAEPDWMA